MSELLNPDLQTLTLFRALMEHTTDVWAVLAADGQVVQHNPALPRALGFLPEAGYQINLHDWIHPEDRCTLDQFGLQKQLHSIPVVLSPFRLRHQQHWRWYEGTAVPLLQDPQVQGTVLSIRDVTVRMQAEQRSHHLHGLTSTLSSVQNTDEVVQVILLQGLEVMGAQAGSVMLLDTQRQQVKVLGSLGYPEALEAPWRTFPLQAPTPAGDAIRLQQDIFLTADEWNLHYPHMQHVRNPRNGRSCALVLQAEGQTLGALALNFTDPQPFSDSERHFLRDVTSRCADALQRGLLHSRLQEQEKRFRRMTEHSHDIISVMDLDGNMRHVSPAMHTLLGYAPEEREGRSGFMDIHPDDLPHLMASFQNALLNPGKPILATYRFRHKKGHWVWLESSGTFHQDDPELAGVVVNSRDVTARVLTEQQMQLQLHKTQQLIDLTATFAFHQAPEQLVEKALQVCLDLTDHQQGYYLPVDETEGLWAGPGAETDRSRAKALTSQVSGTRACFMNRHQMDLLGWGSLAVLPVLSRGALQGHLVFAAPEVVQVDADMQKLLQGVSEQVSQAMQRSDHLTDLQRSREETLKAMGMMLEYRDYETKGHTDRVVQLSDLLGRALGFSGEALDALRWGAYLHDTGKIAIPDHILLKPGKLDASEWKTIQQHPVIGHELLRHIPTLPAATLDVVLHHHERWDGSGYPDRMAGEAIPLAARAFALIDVYDALTDARPYKRAWTHQEAMEEIVRTSGSHFDPEITRIFVEMMEQLHKTPLQKPEAT